MKIEKTWTTKAGYQATVKIMPQGHRCGYVTLPDGHPCNGKDYNDLAIQVHGDLTYGEVATFGFSCAHYGDKAAVRCKAHDHIQSKMQELVEAPYTYFQEAHAMAVLGVEYDASSYDHMQEQRARHIGLDSLIQELECST